MNFLKKLGVSSDVIQELPKKYEPGVLNNALLDEKKIVEAIVFLKANGFTNLNNLVLYNFTFLFLGKKKIYETLEKVGLEQAISQMNKDIKYLDKIMKV